MSAAIGWLWRSLYRLLCIDCGRIMWRRENHHGRHAACIHATDDRLYTRARRDHGYDIAPWACRDCGREAVLR